MGPKEAPGTGRVERKKEETKGKIIAVALRLFRENGIDATTMEQIAAEADIAKGTLYNYFPVKEAIIAAFITRLSLERNSERAARLRSLPDTRTRMVLMLSELIEAIRAQKEIFEKYWIYRVQHMIALERDEQTESGLLLLETAIIELGQQAGELRSDLPLVLLKALFEFVFIEVAQQFYLDPQGFDAAKTIEQCVDLFLDGAGKPEK